MPHESTTYGDFSGLDDLWTERPEVVSGMEKIYEKWVRDFDIDGFRIDTVKHVDLDFWTQWATALDTYAAKHGRDDFFMFGEVYSADTAITSPYVTQGRLDATLDFPFQEAARQYASQGAPASKLAAVLGDDYRYTTDKANAYEQVTFLGNHDMGRIATFLKQDNPKADDAELVKRARLANEVMFLSRGNPVVYYGDEQGFTGAAWVTRTPARPCSPRRPPTTSTTTSWAPTVRTPPTRTTPSTPSTAPSPLSPS